MNVIIGAAIYVVALAAFLVVNKRFWDWDRDRQAEGDE